MINSNEFLDLTCNVVEHDKIRFEWEDGESMYIHTNPEYTSDGVSLSITDVKRLRDFLNKMTGFK